jgi:WXXGXW repeat (2 copies)
MDMRRFYSVICISLALTALAIPCPSEAQVICISNVSPPPELPVYEQPPIPAPGYMWTPGYWASGPNGYFWVPGTWVLPPTVGLLWTPGYWGWRDGIYLWNAGYWGPHIGFYGGVNYGFGYGGIGYEGGRWENDLFVYNRTVNNFGSVTIAYVYEKTVIVEPGAIRVSFNGGSGGTMARPTPEEEVAAHEQHVAAIPEQLQHERTASANKAMLASENRGRPAIAATAKPGEFTGKGVVAAREEKPATTLPGAKPTGAAPVSAPTSVPSGNKPAAAVGRRTKPTDAGTLGAEPTGTTVPEKKGPVEQEHATLKGGTPPKTEARPVIAAPPPQAVKPKPPTSAAAVKPPPQPPAKPAAKPACPPGKTMTPAGCK